MTRARGHALAAMLLLITSGVALAAWIGLPAQSGIEQRLQRGLPLRVGYALEPPYAYVDDAGVLRGESLEVLNEVLRRAGIDGVRPVRLDLGSLISELEAGRIDLIAGGLFITPERAARVRFTRPTAAVGPALLLREPAPVAGETVRVVVIEGSVEAGEPGRYIGGDHRVLSLPDARSALAALRIGEADALALSAPSLRWMAHQLNSEVAVQVQTIDTPARGFPAFAVAPAEEAFARRLDRHLADYIGSPEHLRQVEPYGFLAEDIEAARSWGDAQ